MTETSFLMGTNDLGPWKPPACPQTDCQLQGKAGAMQEKGVFCASLWGQGWFTGQRRQGLFFTFNRSMYPWKRPRIGAGGLGAGSPGGNMGWCLSVHTVFGWDLTWPGLPPHPFLADLRVYEYVYAARPDPSL